MLPGDFGGLNHETLPISSSHVVGAATSRGATLPVSRSVEAAFAGQIQTSSSEASVTLNVRDPDAYQDEPRSGGAGEISAVTTYASCIARADKDSRERRLRCPHGLTRPSRG